jgi:flagellar basal body-associated protein FliL
MILIILTHLAAALVGAGLVFVFVHKKPAQAQAAANSLAGKVEEAKTVLQDLKKTP